MTLKIYDELEQGSDAWLKARAGIVTASIVGNLISPKTLKPASNDTSRGLTASLVAERITGQVEDSYTSGDMLRGTLSEPYAREIYSEDYGPVEEAGLLVNNEWGFEIGFSPDGMPSEGLLEIKSPRAKKHVQTLIEDEVPREHLPQLHTGMLVSGRPWVDFVSYCPGHPFYVKRVHSNHVWQEAIIAAVAKFEKNAADLTTAYHQAAKDRRQSPWVDVFAQEEIQI